MSTLYPDNAMAGLMPERMEMTPGFAEMRQRFLEGFEPEVNRWKREAIDRVLSEEFGCPSCPSVLTAPQFINDVMRRVEDAAVRAR